MRRPLTPRRPGNDRLEAVTVGDVQVSPSTGRRSAGPSTSARRRHAVASWSRWFVGSFDVAYVRHRHAEPHFHVVGVGQLDAATDLDHRSAHPAVISSSPSGSVAGVTPGHTVQLVTFVLASVRPVTQAPVGRRPARRSARLRAGPRSGPAPRAVIRTRYCRRAWSTPSLKVSTGPRLVGWAITATLGSSVARRWASPRLAGCRPRCRDVDPGLARPSSGKAEVALVHRSGRDDGHVLAGR